MNPFVKRQKKLDELSNKLENLATHGLRGFCIPKVI
jgi:hypothetical protein